MSEETTATVWILVDHSSRESAFQSIAARLNDQGVTTEILTINQALGISAKGALSGSAERLVRGLRVAFRGRQDEDFVGAVQRARPDLLVVTDARYVRALSLLESVAGSDAVQIGVAVDYNLSDQWTKSSLRGFIVPHEHFKTRLSKQGFSSERILIGGPPIQGSFEKALDRDEIRSEFKFDDDTRTILVRANSFPTADLDKLVFQLTIIDTKSRFLFHHDGDGTVAAILRDAAGKYGLKANMFGKVNDLERFVVASDVVVAGPGEPYISEIVALDRPTVFVGPESEDAHQVEFLTDQNVAGHIADVLRVGGLLDNYLGDEWLSTATSASTEIAAQDANDNVSQALLSILDNLDDWRQPVELEPSDDAPSDDSPEDDVDSPFETIGDGDHFETPSYEGLSKAEAKEQLASLILAERDVEKRLAESEKQQARWRQRLEMAREWNEADLADEAEAILRGYLDEGKQLQAELRNVVSQKDKLKAAAGGESTATTETDPAKRVDIEKRFRKMEVDSDLDDLKDRIKRELGE